MKKIKTLLVLSGLVTSLLVGCTTNTKSSAAPSSIDAASSADVISSSIPESTPSVAPSSAPASSSQIVEAVVSISVTSEPTKKSYRTGEELNTEGLVVKATYNTGREETLNAGDYQLSGFDTNATGLQEVIVTYQGKTTKFSVSVFGKDGLEIVSAPDKVVYAVGDEFDATGLVVAQKYGDGSRDVLEASAYTVEGFDSAAAGEKTITVAAGSETATFTVNVYAKDWSAAEKAQMNPQNEACVLVYQIPYVLSFTLEEGGATYIDSDEKAATWYEARTAYAVTEDDLADYKATIEAIKTSKGEQAWAAFETTGISGSRFTDDLDLLGFDDESEVYQYMRYYQDNEDSSLNQVLSIGLDPDGKLLAVSTLCVLPVAWIDGGGYYGAGTLSDGTPYDMVEDLFGLIDSRAQIAYDDASDFDVGFTSLFEVPEHSHDTVVFYLAKGHDSPYISTNLYSKEYDAGSFVMQFTNEHATAGTPAYTQEDFDALIDAYAAKGYTFVEDTETYSVPVYVLDTVYKGYTLHVEFLFGNGLMELSVDVKDFVLPYTADIYLGFLTGKMEAYAETQSLVCQNVPAAYQYDEANNRAQAGYLLGYADTDAGFINGITMSNRNLIKGSLRQTGLLTAAEINALTWQTLSTLEVGTAKVGEEDNAQYQVNADDENVLAFVSGENYYVAVYDPDNATLAVTVTNLTDSSETVVNFAATDFTAATGSNNNPFAGTWENADLKLTLSKSKEIITQQYIQFAAAEKDDYVMVYTVMLSMQYISSMDRYVVVCSIVVACVAKSALQQ